MPTLDRESTIRTLRILSIMTTKSVLILADVVSLHSILNAKKPDISCWIFPQVGAAPSILIFAYDWMFFFAKGEGEMRSWSRIGLSHISQSLSFLPSRKCAWLHVRSTLFHIFLPTHSYLLCFQISAVIVTPLCICFLTPLLEKFNVFIVTFITLEYWVEIGKYFTY